MFLVMFYVNISRLCKGSVFANVNAVQLNELCIFECYGIQGSVGVISRL